MVFVADPSVKSLQSLLGHYRGKDGRPGQGSYHQGNSSKDVVIKVRGQGQEGVESGNRKRKCVM